MTNPEILQKRIEAKKFSTDNEISKILHIHAVATSKTCVMLKFQKWVKFFMLTRMVFAETVAKLSRAVCMIMMY